MMRLAVAHPKRNFELVVVGNRLGRVLPDASNLKIIYTGVLTEVQLFLLMKQVSLLLVASKSENSPNIVAEAQLNELLVLACNVGGIPEMISNFKTGFLCEPNEASMEQKLSEILELPRVEINKIVENASKVAKKRHDPNDIHLAVMTVYKRAGLEI
jgi:glycosyltransferase involved in cell wall biosynthesis